MIQPASLEELASLVEKAGKKVFLFVADVWRLSLYLSCLTRD